MSLGDTMLHIFSLCLLLLLLLLLVVVVVVVVAVVVVVVVVVVAFGPYINWRLSHPRLLSSCVRRVVRPFVLTTAI
jgi:hypothetical protein